MLFLHASVFHGVELFRLESFWHYQAPFVCLFVLVSQYHNIVIIKK